MTRAIEASVVEADDGTAVEERSTAEPVDCPERYRS